VSDFTILAIDPGLSGALAFYNPRNQGSILVFDMPRVADEVDAAHLGRIISKNAPTVAVIEKVGPMPRDGCMQAWRFSAANTTAKVVCAMLGVPTSLLSPQAWKAGMKVKGGAEGKEQCRLMALRLFPHCSEYFHLKKHAGRAEAALLAYWVSNKFVYTYENQSCLNEPPNRIELILPKTKRAK
jgi:hypothetical protein